MGLDIMFYKTQNISFKKADDAYKQDLNDELAKYSKKCERLLKGLKKEEYVSEGYVIAYAKFLNELEKHHKVLYESFKREYEVLDVNTIEEKLMSFRPRLPKYKKYYRKLWFIYEYVLRNGIIEDGEEYCWLSESSLERMIGTLTREWEKGHNYYGFMCEEDELKEFKMFINDMKQLKRNLKSYERIYIDFSF